jgi:RNA polymerase sigma factor (sigma-70 family)
VPEPDFDLTACLARVAAGDAEAARALVAHGYPLVERLVRAHRGRHLGADDLMQDVFAKMFGKLHLYEPRADRPFEHWLARLTVNTCRDAVRSEERRARAVPLSPGAEEWLEMLAEGGARSFEDDVAARELVHVLLAELPADDRLVLTLLDLEERSVEEVSALTGWSRTLVKVRAFRARRRLRGIAARLSDERDGKARRG